MFLLTNYLSNAATGSTIRVLTSSFAPFAKTHPFLCWESSRVLARKYRKGDVLCRADVLCRQTQKPFNRRHCVHGNSLWIASSATTYVGAKSFGRSMRQFSVSRCAFSSRTVNERKWRNPRALSVDRLQRVGSRAGARHTVAEFFRRIPARRNAIALMCFQETIKH